MSNYSPESYMWVVPWDGWSGIDPATWGYYSE